MLRALALMIVVVLSASVWTAGAGAQAVNAPPGLSGVDEYLETVPGATGAERPGGGRGPRGAPTPLAETDARAGDVLSPATLEALERAGRDGAEVKRLAAANSPAVDPGRSGVDGIVLNGGSGGSVDSVLSTLGGSSGAGSAFPIGLAAATLALAFVGLRRRRAHE